MRIIFVIVAAVTLAGCAMGPTPQQVAAGDDAECRSYGAAPGTDAYFNCRMAKDRQRQQNRAALAAALISSPPPQPVYVSPQVVAPPPSVNCTSSRIGNQVHTNCY